MVEIVAGWKPDGSNGAAHRQWAQDLWESLAPFALPGGYANLLTAAGSGTDQRCLRQQRRSAEDVEASFRSGRCVRLRHSVARSVLMSRKRGQAANEQLQRF